MKHIESSPELAFQMGKLAGASENAMAPVVVHCLDATYPITHVHMMPDGSIGIEIALHETGEPCNCD